MLSCICQSTCHCVEAGDKDADRGSTRRSYHHVEWTLSLCSINTCDPRLRAMPPIPRLNQQAGRDKHSSKNSAATDARSNAYRGQFRRCILVRLPLQVHDVRPTSELPHTLKKVSCPGEGRGGCRGAPARQMSLVAHDLTQNGIRRYCASHTPRHVRIRHMYRPR